MKMKKKPEPILYSSKKKALEAKKEMDEESQFHAHVIVKQFNGYTIRKVRK